MKKSNLQKLSLAFGAIFLTTFPIMAVGTLAAAAPPPSGFTWETVVNNNDLMPGSGGKTFNSYNQPSVNAYGVVVMRARSRGGQEGGQGNGDGEGGSGGSGGSGNGEGSGGHQGGGGGNGEAKGPSHGIFLRDMAEIGRPIVRVLDRTTEVPQPNNLGTMFVETPSFPRIDIRSETIAIRGNHQPVWEYTLDGEHTRAGTTGIYTNPCGPLITGVSKLGDVREFSLFEVPEYPGTPFEVFPGAPSVTNGGIIVFKGNYSVPDPHIPMSMIGRTGVYYRQVAPGSKGKTVSGTNHKPEEGYVSNIRLVANTDTQVPNLGKCGPGTTFGSTSPPSAADGHMVFVGYDNEEDPTCGGIYHAPLTQPPGQFTKLVGLETEVPGQGGATFSRLGEAVSYDGRFVAFWGAWGKGTRSIRLYCPEEGNQIRRDFCNNAGDFAPDRGDPDSICDESSGACFQEREVPVHQGVFVYDTYGNNKLWMIARTGDGNGFDDFVYWNYSGAPPGGGEGEDDGEPPRWRSSAFLAVSQRAGATFRVAFLARHGLIDYGTFLYNSPVEGIYLAEVLGAKGPKLTTLVQTGMPGTVLDPHAIDPDTNAPLPISSIGLERDSFRGRWLAISAAMGNEEAGWAGIYLTKMPVPAWR